MHTEKTFYDASSLESILSYAKRLEGHTLREECDIDEVESFCKRRGSFGNAVEQGYFHIPANNRQEADFPEVGLELKTTPLRLKKKKKDTKREEYSAKERLEITKINYIDVVDETWETSVLQKKLQKILLIAYQYDKGVNPIDLLIKIAELWGLPPEDVPTFRNDWNTVVDKVRAGRAHELSGSDTLYLEASTKGASGKDRTKQPFSDIAAKPRAWSIKASYMTTVLNNMMKLQVIERSADELDLDLVSLVKKRFDPYMGLTKDKLAAVFGYTDTGKKPPKHIYALITSCILGVVGENPKIAEFEKAGIVAKTIRLERNGKPKESVSFPAFDYFDLAEKPFDESDFWNYLHQKYLFVIYRVDDRRKDVYWLSEVMLWQMPDRDLIEAKRCYNLMQQRVRAGRADQTVKTFENRCCHVRTHGKTKKDTLPTPYGTLEPKKCFWLNASYVGSEIDRVERLEKERIVTSAKADRKSVSDQVIRIAELFAGVGGFRLGLEGYSRKDAPELSMPAAGPFKTVWANQWEPPGTPKKQFAAACYKARFGEDSLINEDIHAVLDAYESGDIDIPDVDMVVGGFPCQDYSVAKPLSKAKGIDGKKGVLWWDIYRFLQLKNTPRFVLLENVDRLLKSPASQRGRDFAIILSCFASLGYAVEWRVVNGADYGFPQKRRRTYIFAEKTAEAWDLDTRLNDGVMNEAFPATLDGDQRELQIFEDPYDNTERFGVGLKTSPFEVAGVMQDCKVVTARMATAYTGDHQTLGDVLVPDCEVPESFYVPDDKLAQWEYLKGGKSEVRTNRTTGFTYTYSEGAMAFPDRADAPARTILTSEGGGRLLANQARRTCAKRARASLAAR